MKNNPSSKIYIVVVILSIIFFHSNVNANSKFASNVRQIDGSSIQLSVWSNAYALPADLEQMAFKLAAKAAVNRGYDYFSLVHNYVSSEKSNARFSSKNDRSTIVFSKTKNGKPVEEAVTQNSNDLSITFDRFLVSTIIQFSNVDSGDSARFVYRAIDVLRGTAYLEDYFDQSKNAVGSAVQALRAPEEITAMEIVVAATPAATSVDIQKLLDAINIAFAAKNWQKVVKLSSEIIEQAPDNYLAYSNRSGALAEMSQLESALKDVNRAIMLAPSHKASYHNRAYVYALLKDNESASIDYKKACDLGVTVSCEEFKKLSIPVKTHIASIKELHSQSNAAFNQQQWNKVIELSTQIIEQDVSNYLAYSNRSGAYAELGNLSDALDDVDMALTLNSDYKDAYHNRGYIHEL
ncbi:MAG: hypothetical protein ACC707_11550, partial [Thiohalomonadales bacterium]